jgi:hypothetical protein
MVSRNGLMSEGVTTGYEEMTLVKAKGLLEAR